MLKKYVENSVDLAQKHDENSVELNNHACSTLPLGCFTVRRINDFHTQAKPMKKNDSQQQNNRSEPEGQDAQSTFVMPSFSPESVSLRDMPAEPNAAPESRLGERVRFARNDLKLNIEALSRLTKEYDAQGSGLSPTSIARYESGESLPGTREFRILCESLDVPLTWLLYGDPTEDAKVPKLTDGEKNVLIGLRSMMAEDKDDFSVEQPPHQRDWLKVEIRNAKLARARKPQ